jgi:hypothetical protein
LIRDEEGKPIATLQEVRRTAAAIAIDIARDEVVDQDSVEMEVAVGGDGRHEVLRTRISFHAEWLE